MECTVCFWPMEITVQDGRIWKCSRCNYLYTSGVDYYLEKIGTETIVEYKSNSPYYVGFDITMFAVGKIQLINARRYNLWRWSIIPSFIPFADDNFYKTDESFFLER